MVRRLKWIGLYISLLFVVLSGLVVSPKAKAVDFTQLVQYIGTWDITHNPSGGTTCNPQTTGNFYYVTNTGSSACNVTDSVLSLSGLGFNNRYIFELDYYIYDYRDKEELNGYINSPPTITMDNGRFPIKYLGADAKNVGNDSAIISYYLNIPYTNTLNTGDNFRVALSIGLQPNETVAMSPKMTLWSYYQPTGGSSTSIDLTQVINAINEVNNTNDSWLSVQTQRLDSILQLIRGNQQNIQNIDNSVQNIENNFDQQQQQAEQDGQQSQDDSNQSGEDVESSTTNILSAITGFFGAFTSASATTCQTDWGIEGFRNFDFCGTQIPTALRVVFTIVASIIFIPMIWFLINSILSAFKEFQQ